MESTTPRRLAGFSCVPGSKGLRAAALLLFAMALGACRREAPAAAATALSEATPHGTPSGPLTVYCGRGEPLMAPLFDRFGDSTGVSLVVRYGETWPLEAEIVREGTSTPAAVFVAQDVAALGALSRKGMLHELPMEVVQQVEPRFAGNEAKHDWLGLSARARAVVYDPARTARETLPRTLEAIADPRFDGRFGIAPANDSFQAQLALYRVLNGRDALAKLLADIRGNHPRLYPDNGSVVQAVARGEIDFGLVNHYSLWRESRELASGEPASGRLVTVLMTGGGVAGFVNAAGVGVLSDDPRALDLVRFLISRETQETLARETYEYPLTKGMAASRDLPPLASLRIPRFDFADIAAVLEETEGATRKVGW
jgi:iron(III) transport system substrate-binding protein